MKNIVHRHTCRVCGSTDLVKFMDLGEMYLQGSFVQEGYPEPPKRKVPLELVWCDTTKDECNCGLVQLSKTISPDILYSTYWYRSGTNDGMKKHLKDIVDKVVSYIGYNGNKMVLDIGANDCTMLSYYPKTYNKWGVDPSNSILENTDKTITCINDIFPSKNIDRGVEFDAITSIAMLYDLENPVNFCYNIESHLKDNGIWVFEMSYLPSMIDALAFDTICNEHIEYYTLSVIEYMLEIAGLKLIDATLNDTNGGSVQCVATKIGFNFYKENKENLNKLRLIEFEGKFDTIEPYVNFRKNVKNIINDIKELIQTMVDEGKVIHLLGASTKGNTLLQACGIDNTMIKYASDRNPDKWDGYTLGTNIKIISEEESRAMAPDAYLVLPWHFKQNLIEREREYIMDGGSLIFPLPKLTVINKDNIDGE